MSKMVIKLTRHVESEEYQQGYSLKLVWECMAVIIKKDILLYQNIFIEIFQVTNDNDTYTRNQTFRQW